MNRKTTTLILCIFFGYFGVHRFYNRKYVSGVIYLFTCGVFCFGWLYDIFAIATNRFNYPPSFKLQQRKQPLPHFEPTQAPPKPPEPRVEPTQAPNTPPKKPSYGKKYQYIYNDVKIYTPSNREPDYDSLSLDVQLTLKQEPINKYDKNAVMVYQQDIFLGYLHKGKLQTMANDYISGGITVDARINKYNQVEKEILVELMFPFRKAADLKTFKLTGSATQEMQESISLCNEGDELSIEYDYDKEKYVVLDEYNSEIGYLPKAAEKYVNDDADREAEFIIDSIDINDSSKYVVTVALRV